jgi:hypothetical protein
MGNIAMLIIGALVATAYLHQPTPEQGFQAAQVEAQKVVDVATPHILNMADVVKKQIEVVKADASQTASHTAQAAPVRVAMVVRQASWQDRTSAKNCYPTGYGDNIACYASPR